MVGILVMVGWAFFWLLLHFHLKAITVFPVIFLLTCCILGKLRGRCFKTVGPKYSGLLFKYLHKNISTLVAAGISYCAVFHYRALLKVSSPGQSACMALHPFPCPTWLPSPQAAPRVDHMLVVVRSADAVASSPGCSAKGVRWVLWAALPCVCPWGHAGLQLLPATLPAWIMGCPEWSGLCWT